MSTKSTAYVDGIKPIQTRYKGYHFRSRLEARWAVYFEAIGLKWEYELEGFDLGSLGFYLPDFWLPQVSMWAEVKSKEFTHEENLKAMGLADITRYPVLRLVGTPDFKTYLAWLPGPHASNEPQDREDDFLISMYHSYPLTEGRFYQNSGYGGEWYFGDDWPEDGVIDAIVAARSARFEHGESPL